MLINLDNFPNYTSNNLKKRFMFLLINKMYDVPKIVLESKAALVSEMKLVNNITDWVVDTRATRHICFNNELFLNYEEVINEENVYLGDSSIARVARKGKVLLKFTSGKSLALHSNLHVSNMCRNLVSGFLLNKTDLKIVFESKKIILSQNGDFVGKGFCHEGLFVLETDIEENIVKLILETNILIRRLITMDFIRSSFGSCCYIILLTIFFFLKKKV